MKSLQERVRRGREAIVKAKSEGKDTSKWEELLANLESRITEQQKERKPSGQRVIKDNSMDDPNFRVKVTMGQFGFCTCSLEKALCTGCWRVMSACACRELEVNPKEEITRQYAQFLKRINTSLRIAKH